MTPTPIAPHQPVIKWEPLPADYLLPDDPVDNIFQPLLAAALREALELAGLILPNVIIATNFGICTRIDDQTTIKAPDWIYIPNVIPTEIGANRRSYTPYTEGDRPALVMEFLSDTDGTEYSVTPTFPYGKWYFYERILQVPIYVIFDPLPGTLEVYDLQNGTYQLRPNTTGRYWIESLQLYLGIWEGRKAEINAYWLRFWDQQDNLLLWDQELLTQKEEILALERQNLVHSQQQVAQLRSQLISLGIDPGIDPV